MPIDKQVVSFPFAQGIDTKTDQKQVQPGRLTLLQNGYMPNPMAIAKRHGYSKLGTTQPGSYGLTTFRDEILNASKTNDFLNSYSEVTNDWGNPRGEYRPIDVGVSEVYQSNVTVNVMDSAWHPSGLQCFVYAIADSSEHLLYSVIDSITGEKIVAGTIIGTNVRFCKVIPFNSSFVIAYNDGSLTRYVFRHIEVATPTAISLAINIGSTAPLGRIGDIDITVVNTRVLVAYIKDGAPNNLALTSINASFTVNAEVLVTGETNIPGNLGAISIWGNPSTNDVWVGYASNGNYRVVAYTFGLGSQVFAPKTVAAAGTARVTGIYNTSAAQSEYYYQTGAGISSARYTATGTFTGGGILILGVSIVSKPFVDPATNISCFMIAYFSQIQGTFFLLKAESIPVVLAKASGSSTFAGIGHFNNPSTGVYQVAINPVQAEIISNAGSVALIDSTSSVVFTMGSPMIASEIGNNVHLSGGFLSSYDGQTIVEHGFHLFPEGSSAVVAAGGSIAAGTYQYVFTYEWFDNQGQQHKSAPSIPLTVVVGAAAQKVTLTIPSLTVTAKQNTSSPVIACVYRTTSLGTLFYRLNQTSAPVTDVGLSTVTFVDTFADASITGNTELYTTGGEVDNGEPPGVLAVTTYKNRLIAIPSENRQSFWYSKQIIPGSPVEMSPFFVQNIDSRGGDATAVGVLDDKLIIFKDRHIFAVVGDGPTPSGANNDFTPGQLVASDTGCISAPSVVLMPDGLMYQSKKGIEILDRSLATHYIGADVEAYVNGAGATVTSAVLVAKLNQVRFTLSTGVCVVYDYFTKGQDGMGQWLVFTNHSAVGAVNFQDEFTFAQADGQVFQENPALFTDNGAFVQLKVVSAWLSLAGLQGFQRAYKAEVLGEFKSAHHLAVSVAYDFDPTLVQNEDITTDSSLPYQYRILLNRQKCETVQFTIMDTQSSSFGEGMSLSALALEIGAKGGLNRSPTSKTYG